MASPQGAIAIRIELVGVELDKGDLQNTLRSFAPRRPVHEEVTESGGFDLNAVNRALRTRLVD